MIARGALLLWALLAATAAAQDSPPPSCDSDENFHLLDFWVGEWDVRAGDELVGHNRIEKIMDGCAILEHWRSVAGGRGLSLFYVDGEGGWKQVWVTPWALAAGGVKEKRLVSPAPPDGVRFQGTLRHPTAGTWLDRTTLSRLDAGDVRQVIEISRDGGKNWETTFDAVYRRSEPD